ncbi:SDR family oxidoreductase [Flavonifractor sp. AGMB03687]|uniref:SDR family NAD(P)-dependent oxidoreductase n=1 Tax=Flavonifractor sp. AGMB03687 TaxID=2785133 RepID=UPI001AE046BE|nr:SDR family oxidoreductase [Flavonifractor sp. AGMB03687]
MELQDRVAIITGASSGIGEVIAQFYLKEGAYVYGCGLEPAANFSDPRFFYQQCDICDPDQTTTVVEGCVREFGKVDILVNCAGVTGLGTIDDTSVAEFRRQFEINVFGLYTMTKAAIDEVRKSEHAVIVNIVSELGVKAIPNRIAYCPSKAAVEMLTRCLAADCGPRVRVNGILPGLTETPMTKMRYEDAPDPEAERQKTRDRYVLKRMCVPEDVANGAVFLASDRSSFITGDMLAVCGGGQFITCQ